MKPGQSLWTREELIIAINLYCKLPFGKMHKTNADIIKLAELIGRTPSSVALKLGNFASFDPTLKARGIKGAPNASKLDKEIWDEFYNNWDEALLLSEELLAQKHHSTIEEINKIELDYLPKDGKEKERLVKTRVNQSLFRNIVLATAYPSTQIIRQYYYTTAYATNGKIERKVFQPCMRLIITAITPESSRWFL